jgi:hypothetical protein
MGNYIRFMQLHRQRLYFVFWTTIIAHKSNLCLQWANSNLSRVLCVLPTSSSLTSPPKLSVISSPYDSNLESGPSEGQYNLFFCPYACWDSWTHMTVQTLYSILKTEPVRSSETTIKIYHTTLRHIVENSKLSYAN